MKSKIKVTMLACAASILASSSSFAAKQRSANDYESNYYESEGAILMKVRGMGVLTKSKQKKFPDPSKNPPEKEGNLFTNGIGMQGSAGIFFTDRFGAELGLSAILLRSSNSALKAAQANYGVASPDNKPKDTTAIPLEILGQYHPFPYGAIRPYVGAGYNYTYFHTQSRQYKLGASHGMVGQIGVDFVLNDDSMINLDLKTYQMEPKLTYKKGLLGGNREVKGKAKINPVVLSVGMGWKF